MASILLSQLFNGINSQIEANLSVTKIDAITGVVIWSYRCPGLNEASTITKRGSRHVLMGDTAYFTPANNSLAKPMAIAINDADGSVVWAKKYFERHHDLRCS